MPAAPQRILPFVLIVVAITGPSLLRSCRGTDDVAIDSLRAFNIAAAKYASTYKQGFPPRLDAFGPPPPGKPASASAAGLVDEALASGRKEDFVFTYQVTARDQNGSPSAYTINADAAQPGNTDHDHYFTDQSGVIRFKSSGRADAHSPPIGHEDMLK